MALSKLKVTAGPEEGRTIDIEGDLVIGRGDDAGLVIADDQLSRRHAVLRATAHGVEVEDLGSLNGTFVNGERIEGKVALAPGGTLRVGTSHMAVEVVVPAPVPPVVSRDVPATPPVDATRIRPTPAPTPEGAAPPVAAPPAAPPAGAPPGFGPPGEMPRIPPPVRLMLKILTKVPPGRLLMKRLVKMPMKRRVHVLIFMTFLMFAIPVAIILVLFVI